MRVTSGRAAYLFAERNHRVRCHVVGGSIPTAVRGIATSIVSPSPGERSPAVNRKRP